MKEYIKVKNYYRKTNSLDPVRLVDCWVTLNQSSFIDRVHKLPSNMNRSLINTLEKRSLLER